MGLKMVRYEKHGDRGMEWWDLDGSVGGLFSTSGQIHNSQVK